MLSMLVSCESLRMGGSSSAPPPGSGTEGGEQAYEEVNYYYDFDDVLVPKDLKYDDSKSYVFETMQFRTGKLVFDGHVDALSVVDFFVNNMAKDNWRKNSSMKSDTSVIIFEKPNKSCMIKVVDASLSSTEVEIMVVELKQHGNDMIRSAPAVQEQDLAK
jgi:hypothetical protein